MTPSFTLDGSKALEFAEKYPYAPWRNGARRDIDPPAQRADYFARFPQYRGASLFCGVLDQAWRPRSLFDCCIFDEEICGPGVFLGRCILSISEDLNFHVFDGLMEAAAKRGDGEFIFSCRPFALERDR